MLLSDSLLHARQILYKFSDKASICMAGVVSISCVTPARAAVMAASLESVLDKLLLHALQLSPWILPFLFTLRTQRRSP